jgi:hypothetical protein
MLDTAAMSSSSCTGSAALAVYLAVPQQASRGSQMACIQVHAGTRHMPNNLTGAVSMQLGQQSALGHPPGCSGVQSRYAQHLYSKLLPACAEGVQCLCRT